MSQLAESPIDSERLLGMLPLISGLTEKWSGFEVEEHEDAVVHYFVSSNLYCRGEVGEDFVHITVVSRSEPKVVASRQYSWKVDGKRAVLTAVVDVTTQEMQVLETRCKAKSGMTVKETFGLWLKLDMFWRIGKRDELLGSASRFLEVLGPVRTAAMLHLELVFRVRADSAIGVKSPD